MRTHHRGAWGCKMTRTKERVALKAAESPEAGANPRADQQPL